MLQKRAPTDLHNEKKRHVTDAGPLLTSIIKKRHVTNAGPQPTSMIKKTSRY